MKFNWLWHAHFSDGKVIVQPEDDKYSKHDDNKDWNPSSFRDFLDYFNENRDKLTSFGLVNREKRQAVLVRFDRDEISMFSYKDGDLDVTPIKKETERLVDAQPIYYRRMQNKAVNGVFGEPEVLSYTIGYQGRDKNGKNVKFMQDISPVGL